MWFWMPDHIQVTTVWHLIIIKSLVADANVVHLTRSRVQLFNTWLSQHVSLILLLMLSTNLHRQFLMATFKEVLNFVFITVHFYESVNKTPTTCTLNLVTNSTPTCFDADGPSSGCFLLLLLAFYNPRAGFRLLILEVSRSHTMTRHSR